MARSAVPKGAVRRGLNGLMAAMLRRGLGPPGIWLLTTRGRKSGRPRTTPVSLVEMDGTRFLVSPYGTPAWVHNARAAGEVTLQRGKHKELRRIEELEPEQAAPVLKRYIQDQRVVRPWFDAKPDDPVGAFVGEAPRHPVFRLG